VAPLDSAHVLFCLDFLKKPHDTLGSSACAILPKIRHAVFIPGGNERDVIPRLRSHGRCAWRSFIELDFVFIFSNARLTFEYIA